MRAAVLTAAVGLVGLTATPSLHVLRSSPAATAAPTDVVSVTFDRPVAGSLDATVDPRSIFSIQPLVTGALEWRDPITLRFTPGAPLTANATYTVTIANTFQA